MPDLISAALAEAYACAPSEVVILPTLEINHPLFDIPIRLVNDHSDLVAKIEDGTGATFIRFAFDLTMPEVNAQGNPEVQISIDGASAEIAQQLDLVADSSSPLKVTIRVYRSDDLSGPANYPIEGEITFIDIDVKRVTLTVGFGRVANKPFPAELYTPSRFPGLVR